MTTEKPPVITGSEATVLLEAVRERGLPLKVSLDVVTLGRTGLAYFVMPVESYGPQTYALALDLHPVMQEMHGWYVAVVECGLIALSWSGPGTSETPEGAATSKAMLNQMALVYNFGMIPVLAMKMPRYSILGTNICMDNRLQWFPEAEAAPLLEHN